MGATKQALLEQIDMTNISLELAKKAGLVEECVIHDEFYLNETEEDLSGLYKLIIELHEKDDPALQVFHDTGCDLLKILTEVTEEVRVCARVCHVCEHQMSSD